MHFFFPRVQQLCQQFILGIHGLNWVEFEHFFRFKLIVRVVNLTFLKSNLIFTLKLDKNRYIYILIYLIQLNKFITRLKQYRLSWVDWVFTSLNFFLRSHFSTIGWWQKCRKRWHRIKKKYEYNIWKDLRALKEKHWCPF